jgi:hypothetical protein
MRRFILVLAVTGFITVMLAGLAYATPEQGPNPGNPNAAKSGNCIGDLSAAISGNGATIRDEGQSGTRDDLIQTLQEDCNNANQK